MGEDDRDGPQSLARIARVRCLGCNATYIKPAAGSTVDSNPGCPECGYVGWVTTSAPVTEPSLQLRSALGHLRHRSA